MKIYYEIGGRTIDFTQEKLDNLRTIVQDWSDRMVMWQNGELDMGIGFDIEELICTLKDFLHIGGRYENLEKGETLKQTYMDIYNLFKRG